MSVDNAFEREYQKLKSQQENLESDLMRACLPPPSTSVQPVPHKTEEERPGSAPFAVMTKEQDKENDQDPQKKHTTRSAMLKRYFDAMSDFPDYNERRSQRMATMEPFSFELREQRRTKSTSTKRFEEDNEQRDAEMHAMLHHHFKANAVPPSTYMRKYEVMVQEWCERKESIRLMAQERARRIKEAAEPGKRYALTWQEKKKGSARRAGSSTYRGEVKPFRAREIPLEVKMPKWDEFRRVEEQRQAKIRLRADQLLAVAKRPPRMEAAAMAEASEQKEESNDPVTQLQQRNPNFTFQPNVRTTVPDYEYLWAKERVELVKKKQARPTTTVKEFNMRETRSSVAQIVTDMKREENEGLERRWPYKSTRAKVKPTPIPKRDESPVIPKSTKAQEMKAECAYKTILQREEERHRAHKENHERKKRQAELNRKMSPFLASAGIPAEATIEAKSKEKRDTMRRQSAEAKQKLKQLEGKIREKPPLFMEPTHFDQVSHARAATEQQVLQMLKEHGLAEKTLSAIMSVSDVVVATDVEGTQRQTKDGTATAKVEEKSLVEPKNKLNVEAPPIQTAATTTVSQRPAKRSHSSSSSGSSGTFESSSSSGSSTV